MLPLRLQISSEILAHEDDKTGKILDYDELTSNLSQLFSDLYQMLVEGGDNYEDKEKPYNEVWREHIDFLIKEVASGNPIANALFRYDLQLLLKDEHPYLSRGKRIITDLQKEKIREILK